MPVFVRGGGIIPEQPATGTTEVKVFPGPGGRFDLYGDSGSGLAYGQSTDTPITETVHAGADGSSRTVGVRIGPTRGHYDGAPLSTRYRLDLVGVTRPTGITLDGRHLSAHPTGSGAAGWSYFPDTATVVIDAPSGPTGRSVSAVVSGTRPVKRTEPVAPLPAETASG
jgi:hypothetical protein